MPAFKQRNRILKSHQSSKITIRKSPEKEFSFFMIALQIRCILLSNCFGICLINTLRSHHYSQWRHTNRGTCKCTKRYVSLHLIPINISVKAFRDNKAKRKDNNVYIFIYLLLEVCDFIKYWWCSLGKYWSCNNLQKYFFNEHTAIVSIFIIIVNKSI